MRAMERQMVVPMRRPGAFCFRLKPWPRAQSGCCTSCFVALLFSALACHSSAMRSHDAIEGARILAAPSRLTDAVEERMSLGVGRLTERATSASAYDEVIAEMRRIWKPPAEASARAGDLGVWLRSNAPRFELLDAATRKQSLDPLPLGWGAWGIVYLAGEQVSDGGGERLVALKTGIGKKGEEKLVQECKRNANIFQAMDAGVNRAVADLGARHVVRCVADYSNAAVPFIAMEFAGQMGAEVVAEAAHPEVVLRYVKQVALALAAFDQAVPPQIHYDLKWQNTAVNDGCLKLIDLDSSLPGTYPESVGNEHNDYTEDFAPPEQGSPGHKFLCGDRHAQGDDRCPWAHAWDAYSLGAMTIPFLCGMQEHASALMIMQFGEELALQIVDMFKDRSGLPSSEIAEALLAAGSAIVEMKTHSLQGFIALHDTPEAAAHRQQWPARLTAAFEAKLSFCKEMPLSLVQLLDRMISRAPDVRPRPSEVLRLLSNVSTGCAWDSA